MSDDDVVLVEVDGRPVTLPMLEFLMQARGVAEDDNQGMRDLLDELIRLRVMANAAEEENISNRPEVRAERLIKDIEVQYIRYLEQFQRDHPVSDADIRAAYQRQLQAAGDRRYRLETIAFASQSAAIKGLDAAGQDASSFDAQIEAAGSEGRVVQRTDWIDGSQVPAGFGQAMAATEVGQVVDALLPFQGEWLVVRIAESQTLEPPAFDEVREAIRRTLNRQRNQALIDEMFEAADIKPMLPLDDASKEPEN
ncbi:MAG: peptidylprolyl isomerase [Wenzhouxiangellaceae bacterium]|nr:peptidylprolyl isomerase [Wenzhouxiangellaceae bacterium]